MEKVKALTVLYSTLLKKVLKIKFFRKLSLVRTKKIILVLRLLFYLYK